MDKVHEIAGDGAPMPGFDDGMVDMAGPIRVMAEPPVNEAMGARADGAREGGNRRNGYRELRRRSRVAQFLPGGKSLIRMMGAAFSEMDGDRAGRRRSGDDSIGGAVEGAEVDEPAHAHEGAAAEHAAGIIALAVADNPIPGGKAAQHALE